MSADLLARLIAAGTPAELVAEVAMTLAEANAAASALERRRAAERARQANRRAASRDVTECHVTERDSADSPSLSPSLFLSPQTPQTNSHPHTHPRGESARTRKGSLAAFPPPAGVTAEQWESFVRQRRKKLTPHAYKLLTGKLDDLARDGWPPGKLIDLAIERGWETVFEPKDRRNGYHDKPSGWLTPD